MTIMVSSIPNSRQLLQQYTHLWLTSMLWLYSVQLCVIDISDGTMMEEYKCGFILAVLLR